MHLEIYQDINKIESLNLRIGLLSKYMTYDFIRCAHLLKVNINNKQDKNQLVIALQFQDLIHQKLDHLYQFNKSLTFDLLDLFQPGQSIQNNRVEVFPEIFELNKQLLSLCYNEYQDAVKEINKRFGQFAANTSLSEIIGSIMIYNELFNKEYNESIVISDQLIKSTFKYIESMENSDAIKKARLTKLSKSFTMESERVLLYKIIDLNEVSIENESDSIELF